VSPAKERILDTLWARMAEHGDFPTLSHSIRKIVNATQSQTDHLEKLVSSVISDFSLTQKVLRLANSAMYAPFGGNITTVSRAVLVLGQDAIGHLALGLRLLDSFKGMSANRDQAKQLLAEVMLTGLVARRLTQQAGVKEGEEAVICALLSPLGELVCVFYAPDEWRQIEDKVAADGSSVDAATEAVLGISITELGQATARRWGLPGRLCEAIKPFQPTDSEEPLTHGGWLQAMASYSGELARAVAAGDTAAARSAAERYAPVVAIEVDAAHETLETLKTEAGTEGGWDGLAEVYFNKPGAADTGKPHDAEARLAAGVAEITNSAKECQFSVLLHMALEVLIGSLGCVRAIAFVLDPAARRYSARAGFGQPAAGEISSLYFETGFAPDVFHLTLSSKKPVHVENVMDAKIRSRIPAWHKNALRDARSLVLLPVIVNDRAVALIYADWTGDETVQLTEKEARLLRAMTVEIETAAQQGFFVSPVAAAG